MNFVSSPRRLRFSFLFSLFVVGFTIHFVLDQLAPRAGERRHAAHFLSDC
jgi:hypothetical protein